MTDLLTQFDQALRVEDHLIRHEQYLAHLPASQWTGKGHDETLAEHMDVVIRLTIVVAITLLTNKMSTPSFSVR